MLICIPTRGRLNKQITFNNLSEKLQRRTVMFFDADDWRYSGGSNLYPQVYVTPKQGIGAVRDEIVHHIYTMGYDRVLMMDDDLDFARRREDDPTKFEACNGEPLERMVELVERALDDYHHVAVSHREGANRNTDGYLYNNRALRVLGYRVDTLRKLDIRFGRFQFMEDFGVQLELLTKGYPNCIVNSYVHNQPCSQAAGGCSIYRTASTQRAAAEYLHELFPRFVKIVTRPGWANEPERIDVRVQWKAAFNSAGEA